LTNVNSVQFEGSDTREGTGSALFSGSNYFEISNDGTFSPANFTITVWCKIVQKADYATIASARILSPIRGWIIYVVNNNLQFWTGNGIADEWAGAFASLFTNFAAATPTWRHLAITMTQSTSQMRLYVDGQPIGSYERLYLLNPGTNLRIGAGSNEGTASLFLGAGSRLDDFRMYNSVLSDTAISSIFGNALDCRQCSVGTYSAGAGTASVTVCSTCPAGTTSAPGASTCTWVRACMNHSTLVWVLIFE
jgi:hypothetical protein